jgi:hypothetical protein
MNHLAAGKAVQFAIVAMGGGLGREVLADEPKVSAALSSPIPVAPGHRSERVMSLLLALEALRAAPEVLRTPPKSR